MEFFRKLFKALNEGGIKYLVCGGIKRKKEIIAGDIVIPLAPIDVIIAMIEKTARPQDRADVFYLRKIMKEWKDDR